MLLQQAKTSFCLNTTRETLFLLWLLSSGSTFFVAHAQIHGTHSSAGLMGLESRNNSRSIFRKWRNERCVRSSQLPVSRAALAQSLWCCSELLGIESLPWTLQSVMWKPLQLDQNIEPETENLYNKIWLCLHAFYFTFYSLWSVWSLTDPRTCPKVCVQAQRFSLQRNILTSKK